MVSNVDPIETWVDEPSHTAWKRNATGFSMVSRNCVPVHSHWGPVEIGAALGCGFSTAARDGGSNETPAYFPPTFEWSPNTGDPLIRNPVTPTAWLPPGGGYDLKSGLIRGGKITRYSVQLRDGYSATDGEPPCQLKLPPPGRYRFLVGSFGLKTSFLLALDGANGFIFCWVPSRKEWIEVRPGGDCDKLYLGAESLSPEAWNVEAIDLAGDSKLFWPCDKGLISLHVDPLALTYTAHLVVKGTCLSQPLLQHNHVYCVIEKSGNAVLVEVSAIDSDNHRDCVPNIPTADWKSAIATPNEAIWMSSQGQVIASPRRGQFAFIPWQPEGVQPAFELGPPHCSSDGRLWMQVLHPSAHEGEGGIAYLSLGRAFFDLKESSGVRTLTGHSSIKVEQRLFDDPWIDPAVVLSAGHDNDEVVFPMLESMSDKSILVLRAHHVGSTKDFLQIGDLITTRFQVMGQHADDKGFFSSRLRAPWKTIAFVFNGALYLYHPDLKVIPGWLLASHDNMDQ